MQRLYTYTALSLARPQLLQRGQRALERIGEGLLEARQVGTSVHGVAPTTHCPPGVWVPRPAPRG